MVFDIKYFLIQLIELNKKVFYGQGCISKHIKIRNLIFEFSLPFCSFFVPINLFPQNVVPKNTALFHPLFLGLPKLPYLLILP